MANVDLIMPKMGESIMEATILSWAKNVGDTVQEDEMILEIATDKVDSEIPSPVDGVITEILYQVNDVVPIGTVIARISTEGESSSSSDTQQAPTGKTMESAPAVDSNRPTPVEKISPESTPKNPAPRPEAQPSNLSPATATATKVTNGQGRFYSPLVKSIARKENISQSELDSIPGTGAKGRVNKKDLINYISAKSGGSMVSPNVSIPNPVEANGNATQVVSKSNPTPATPSNNLASSNSDSNVEIIEMDRMRKLIADHMVNSKHTSPHVTSFVEADVTNLVNWRNKAKGEFKAKYGQNITYTPIFVDAVVKAISDFPMVNVSVNGNQIIRKKDINIGMATALPSGNLIVPVIKHANALNLVGLTQKVNDLAKRARENKLKPEDIQDGTFTLTNVGTFGNVMGTPIINQPQAAILATGAIRKKPAVLETEFGDVIAIRQMMYLSLSYDHRVVDGFLGGSFLRKVADYLENFDVKQVV